MRVYPNPWRSDNHPGKSIIFAQLPLQTTVKLFTISGHLVKTLSPLSSSLNKASWDLTNDAGDKISSGVYIYLLEDGYGNEIRGKVAVMK